jgi:hypothetical protein
MTTTTIYNEITSKMINNGCMFSSWFNHTIKATIAARIWQVQEYDDASKSLLVLVSTLPTNQGKWS